jgi:methylglyoxal synthase
MATAGQKTIAFIVGPKNERLAVNYISSHLEALSPFRLLLTDTETKGLEPLLTLGLDVHYLPSLEKKGDVELAHRCSKNQIAAVFVFNPSAVSRQMNTERFFALVEKCWGSDTPLALNASLIDLSLENLIAVEGKRQVPFFLLTLILRSEFFVRSDLPSRIILFLISNFSRIYLARTVLACPLALFRCVLSRVLWTNAISFTAL